MGKLIASAYEKLYKRPAPPYVKEYTVWHVVTIPLRKWLTNAVGVPCRILPKEVREDENGK